MHDTRRVRLGETLGDLSGEGEYLLGGEWSFVHELAERLPLHELHHDVMGALVFTDVVDRRDVRMVERRSGTGLPFESTSSLGVRGKVGGEHFDGDRPLESGVLRLENLAHPARPDGREDFVRPEHPTLPAI